VALALSAGCLTPVALAGAGSSEATGSTGTWISTTPAHSSTPEDFTPLATDSVSNDKSITTESDLTPSSAFNASGDGVVAWENTRGDYVEASSIEPGGTWSEPVLVGTGVNPVVAVDPAGDAVIVFQDTASISESVAYAYSPAGSGRFNSPVKIGSLTPEANPQVVMDSSGNAWVTWSDAYGYDPTSADQYAHLSAGQLGSGANSASAADPVAVRTLGQYSGFTGRAVLATSAGGGVVAAWAAPTAHAPYADEIDVAYAAPGQTTFGPATPLPDSYAGFAASPAVAMNSSGGAVVAWDECDQPSGMPFCADSGDRAVEVASASANQLAASGGPKFNTLQSLSPSSQGGDLGHDSLDGNGEFAPAVAASDNEVAVAWEDRATSFAVDGATEPLADLDSDTPNWSELGGIPAGDDAEGTGTHYSGGPQIAIDTAGDVTLAWNDGTAINVAAALACAATCPSMTVTQLDKNAASGGPSLAAYRPSLAFDANGDLLLSWLSDDNREISPAAVAATYDAGPALTNIEIPTTAASGTPASFSIESSDLWSGLSGADTTTWNFGDGGSATGVDVSHTYATPGTYTVSVVSRAADGASSTIGTSPTISRQILVSAVSAVSAAPALGAAPSPTGAGAVWRSGSAAASVTAELTVPALVCPSGVTAGQDLGAELRGGVRGASTPRTDFAGVEVECTNGSASYKPTFTIANGTGGSTTTQAPSLTVTPGDLLSVHISHTSSHEQLTITDLSEPSERAASTSGPSLATHTGWQVGAFAIAGVKGPEQTLATGFTNVKAGGTGISHLKGLAKNTWGPARVSKIGTSENQFSVLYRRTPQPRVGGGSNAIPANGSDEYELPHTHRFLPLSSSVRLPNGTVIDASGGTVQLTSSEPHGQTQSVTAWGGEFKITNKHNGATVLTVNGTWGGSDSGSDSTKARLSAHKKKKKKITGNLWAKGHGNMSTKGSYGSAAVVGTEWLTRNLKNGTLFKVTKNHLDSQDSITVTVDYPKRHTVTLHPGQSLLAPAPVTTKPVPSAVTLSGASESGGLYNVQIGGNYKLTVVSKTKPFYIDAAVSPLGPLGGDWPFQPDGTVNGTPRWSMYFKLTSNLAAFHYWVVGVRVGSRVYSFRLRIQH
jgi:hypothetical protein